MSTEHTELAMSLYRDPGLVRGILATSDLPEGAERVALSLADPVEGPFVVLSRDGHFVTCLGPGMRTSDLPLITRAKLDSVASQTARLRELMEAARLAVGKETGDLSTPLIRKLTNTPERLTREDVMGLRAWMPLTGGMLLETALIRLDQLRLHAARLRAKDHTPDEREELRLFVGRELESLSCAFQLLAADAHTFIDPKSEEGESLLLAIITPFELHHTRHAVARLCNGAARGGRLFPPVLRKHLQDFAVLGQVRTLLTCIGMAHPRLRAETGKLLHRLKVPDDVIEAMWEAPANYAALEREALAAVEASGAPDPAMIAKHAFSIRLNEDRSDIVDSDDFIYLLPPLAAAEPEDLYIPMVLAEDVPRRDLRPAADLFATRMHRLHGQVPVTAAPSAGRNDPCPCGSGKKFKKCCAA